MRTPIIVLTGALALGTTLTIASNALAAPKNYTLVCNDVQATYSFHDRLFRGKPTLRFFFVRASNAASQRKPDKGQCAWVDRPISAAEPGSFYFRNANNPVTHVKITSQATTAQLMGTGRLSQIPNGGRQSRAAQSLLLLDAIKKAQLFYVQVHSEKVNGRTVLIMDRFGP
jgi:hypothetical protein